MIQSHRIRYIANKFDEQLFMEYEVNPQITQQFIDHMQGEVLTQIINNVSEFCEAIQPGTISNMCSKQSKTFNDWSLFTGSGSYLFLYLKLYKFLKDLQIDKKQLLIDLNSQENKISLDHQVYLEKAKVQFSSLYDYMDSVKDQDISYSFSQSSIWMMGVQLSFYLKDHLKFKICLDKMLKYHNLIMENRNSFEYELLYGVPGYLAVLLEFQKFQLNLSEDFRKEFSTDVSKNIFDLSQLIFQKGFNPKDYKNIILSNQQIPQDFRLSYSFNNREYLGGAHGVIGVLQILLQAYINNINTFNSIKNKEFTIVYLKFIKITLDKLIQLQLPSGIQSLIIYSSEGNFPSSQHSQKDELVQFCHGATGFVQPLIIASKLFHEDRYIESVKKAIKCIWSYGLLKKGSGLCHGVSGNAYQFLSMYKHSKDLVYYQYAWKFLTFKNDQEVCKQIREYDFDDRYKVGKSDHEFSLMLGIVGDIVAQMDFVDVENSKFPGYEF